MADHTKTHEYLARSTRDVLSDYMGDEGYEIADSLKDLNALMPAVLAGRPADKQVSWGITRRDGKFKVMILADDDTDPTIQGIVRSYGGVFVNRLTAEVHSLDPTRLNVPISPLLRERTAGASIGHKSGYPGTLGCFVRKSNWIGVISASHVLGRNNRSRKGDEILSPGSPDGPKLHSSKIGTLEDYFLLSHFENASDNYLCCQDIALVKIDVANFGDVPKVTEVWSPQDPNTPMPIKRVIGGRDVANRLGERVCKVGRTTGLTFGILDIVGLQRQRIVIADSDPGENPTERDYVYTNILAVRCDYGPFSRAGDSGALVYTEDGCAIGIVIAGTEQYSFVSPLDACLQDMQATIL